MADPKRKEMERWLIELDPDAQAAYEESFDSQDSLESDFPDRRGEAEHMKDVLAQRAKSEAEQVIKSSISQDIPPYGKIYCFKQDESGLKELVSKHNWAMTGWKVFVTNYQEMVELDKKLPSPNAITKDLDQAVSQLSPDVKRDRRISRDVENQVNTALKSLKNAKVALDSAKRNVGLAVQDLINEHLVGKAEDMRREAEKWQALVDSVANGMKAAGAASHGDVLSSLGEDLENLKIAYDRLNPDSTWRQARDLQDAVEKAKITSATKHMQAANDDFHRLEDSYHDSTEDVNKARDLAADDSEAVMETFDDSTKGRFPVKQIKEVVRKAGVVKDNSGIGSTVEELRVLTKAAWLTGHPKREENKKATDRMLIAMDLHIKDGVGFQKEADAMIVKWQDVLAEIQRALR
ncbi:MAG: hypothetical protein ACLQU1_26405 [Bryobacteraceae bacterium]